MYGIKIVRIKAIEADRNGILFQKGAIFPVELLSPTHSHYILIEEKIIFVYFSRFYFLFSLL